ncbi:MAG: ABC transporter permease [Erysipelotrichaceae bacterium]|nr:ABC transporter permease [Erysipelotrichaceae bacterium]MDY5251896.1 FtsX-like permease family protein [Erysipelotrichaceae bacterium]
MNFLTRAIKNVIRVPSKSILLGITFFVIGNLVVVGLGLTSASQNAKTLTRQQMRAVVSYEVDFNKFYADGEKIESEEERDEFFKNYPNIDLALNEKMIADERVKAVDAFFDRIAYADGIEYLKNPYAKNDDSYGFTYDQDGNQIEYRPPNFKIQANIFPMQIALYEKTYEVIEGRFYTQEDIDNENKVCLITDELAQLNNLKIGDTITISTQSSSELAAMSKAGIDTSELDMDLEIIGIYHNNKQLDPNDTNTQYLQPFEVPGNTILMPSTTYTRHLYDTSLIVNPYYQQIYGGLESMEMPSYEDFSKINSAYYLLDDPLNVEKFVKDYEGELGQYQILNANNDEFNRMARPLDSISMFASLILLIVGVASVIIITLIVALTLKTRTYEMGVLLSMGVSKAKVILQMFVELLIVAVLGFTLSVISGSLIAGKVGEVVLDYQVETENEYASEDNNYISFSGSDSYFSEVTQEQILSQYEVKISPMIIAEIYVLGLGVVFISIVIPAMMIMRFNPKQILLNTN